MAACSKERQRQSENVPSEAAEVSVFKVSSRPIKSVYESEATIIAEGTVKIASKITAKVAESLLKEGKKSQRANCSCGWRQKNWTPI